ncbi:uncharacterized protein LOC119960329 [Scyliorhinus canicula]|uniref:uncharacterized protein LOC119960329 n=1 Tax=Scyliorhinus canicula TaxID=7830 RepID=UPI0018F2CD6A|nr:uncharacterized protein LOC119960329 [Scyliorhinus canicula]
MSQPAHGTCYHNIITSCFIAAEKCIPLIASDTPVKDKASKIGQPIPGHKYFSVHTMDAMKSKECQDFGGHAEVRTQNNSRAQQTSFLYFGSDEEGCLSLKVKQDPEAVTSEECQTLTINCVYSGDKFENGNFFRQTQPGVGWERISSGGRFVVSVNKAEKTFSLEIRDVRVEDSATYYCKAQYYWSTHLRTASLCDNWKYDYAEGSGTVMTVTADSSSLVSKNPPLQNSAAGDTVTLNWEYSGLCQYTVHSYRQSPGQAPEFLLQRHTSGQENKENAAGGRISASIDTSKKISRLMISKLQPSDSAVYYAALSRHTAQ